MWVLAVLGIFAFIFVFVVVAEALINHILEQMSDW